MIQTQHLCKRYGSHQAVRDLNLFIRRGTVFGLVGENGAGKTTTLSMLATLTTPSAGRAYVNGFEVMQDPAGVRHSIGYMPDSFGVYDDISCTEYLLFYAECYRVPRTVAEARADAYLEWVGLADRRNTYVNHLSRGMQQRLEIARCLMHDPPVLILDEPTSGLDPRSRLEVRQVLRRLRELGKTMIVSSHILQELSEVADEIGVMRRGELVAVASVDVLRHHSSAHRWLRLCGEADDEAWRGALKGDPRVVEVRPVDGGMEVLYAGTVAQQAELLERVIRAGIPVTQFVEQATDIEELFLRLTDGSAWDREGAS
ncbi:ABC transporter ATP-binding protein [Alicyclobacillus sp.]|uniref:ABC transporter ATP-binding protein n=1 Tax=Alicyclobacillus sp. TaxID=61169 RepID=UPI0025C5FF62|nr:ABC transporter ATP-binding protein [Alicyclobacillus sp.]MCL6515943.1 ABC transporter ATP-binding protein [Alicyclobacillus sp.]